MPILTQKQLICLQESADSNDGALGFRFWVPLVVVLILALTLYVSLASGWPKFSRAEVFFAECAREMLNSHNMVTPLYHGQPFFDKPILMYWLIAGWFQALGVSHLAARFPSILAALATVTITGACTAALFGRLSGILAAMALASSFMFLSFAGLCMSDMHLVLFDTSAIALLYAGSLREQRRTLLWWLASSAMGLAFLTKGPVGVALPVMAFALFLAVSRQMCLVKPHHVLVGIATVAVVGAPWFIAAYKANGMWAISYFFLRENLQRFAGSTYDTHKPAWFMLVSLFTGFAPWSVLLPAALLSALSSRWSQPQERSSRHLLFLWLWVAVVTLFFSLSRGKCDYYVLPAYPAAAALVGCYLASTIGGRERPAVFTGWGLALALLVAGGAACYPLSRIMSGEPASTWIAMPLALLTAGAAAALYLRRGRLLHAYCAIFAGICLGGTSFAVQVLPAIGNLQFTKRYCQTIADSPADTRIGIFRTHLQWIDEVTFQTGREPVRIDTKEQLVKFLSDPGPALVVVPENELTHIPGSRLYRIADKMFAISRSITPGYVIQRKGQLTHPTPLLLVTNHFQPW